MHFVLSMAGARRAAIGTREVLAIDNGPCRTVLPVPLNAPEHFGLDDTRLRLEDDDSLAASQNSIDGGVIDWLDKAKVQDRNSAGQIEDVGNLTESPIGRADGDEAHRRWVARTRQSPVCIEFKSPCHPKCPTGFGPSRRIGTPACSRIFLAGGSVWSQHDCGAGPKY